MALTERTGTASAIAISLAVHAAVAVWFALRPPMFQTVRPAAPIEVALVPARPLPPIDAGGGGPEPVAVPAPPRAERPPRARAARPATQRPATRRAQPPPAPAPALPQAKVVDPGVAAPSEPDTGDALANGDLAADLGIGSGSGWGGGSGGGVGGGTGSGIGRGSGPGSGEGEVKPRELRRPSYAEMRALYPEGPRREGMAARVRLQLLVDTSGRVADVRVIRPAGHGFDEAAVALARRFLFEPGRRDGRPTPMWITLTYTFEVEG